MGAADVTDQPQEGADSLGEGLEALAWKYTDPRNPVDQTSLRSIAVSLKRIADLMESGLDPHGDFVFRIERAISEGLRK